MSVFSQPTRSHLKQAVAIFYHCKISRGNFNKWPWYCVSLGAGAYCWCLIRLKRHLYFFRTDLWFLVASDVLSSELLIPRDDISYWSLFCMALNKVTANCINRIKSTKLIVIYQLPLFCLRNCSKTIKECLTFHYWSQYQDQIKSQLCLCKGNKKKKIEKLCKN